MSDYNKLSIPDKLKRAEDRLEYLQNRKNNLAYMIYHKKQDIKALKDELWKSENKDVLRQVDDELHKLKEKGIYTVGDFK